jgi:asparagine synthase (glutamine-hydrolysing)
MCGIFGAASGGSERVNLSAVLNGLQALRHRGPDGEGVYIYSRQEGVSKNLATDESPDGLGLEHVDSVGNAGVQLALGHRRLSILDLSLLGHQPMAYAEDRLWMVFNGEVYNFKELRDELRALGHSIRSGSDSEVILAAFLEWGNGCFSRFIGMFSLAIFDRQSNRLVLARDQFGIKPLFYTFIGETMVFGSEIKALISYPGMGRKCNTQALYDYLRFGLTDHDDKTLFDGVFQLPAAHFAEIDLSAPLKITPQRFWSLEITRNTDISFQEAAVRLRELFEESTALHMRSDVAVGSCLSGGLDSTAIVAAMVGHMGGVELPTFSYIADDEILSEEKYVNIALERYAVKSYQTKPTAGEFASGLPGLVSILDQPFAGWSMFAQHKVFELAQQNGIKVVLDGQGSDELLGGYTIMVGARASGLLAEGKLLKALELLKHLPQNMSAYRRQTVLMAFGRLVPKALQPLLLKAVGASLFPAWFNASYFRERGTVAAQRPAGVGPDALKQELKIATEQISLPRLLRYEDRNSMHFSIESRVPFCNPKIAEFAMSLPPEFLVSDKGQTKHVLREAMRGLVPDSIIDREKVGFAVPEKSLAKETRTWLDEQFELLREMDLPFLNTEVLVSQSENHLKHSKQYDLDQYWRPINVALWAQRFEIAF